MFSELIEDYSIEQIDFMKIDCEGGEYDIFTDENSEFLQSVKKIVIEFHLDTLETKLQFRRFRDSMIPKFKKVVVNSVDGIDIKWSLYNENFIGYYTEILIYIDNR